MFFENVDMIKMINNKIFEIKNNRKLNKQLSNIYKTIVLYHTGYIIRKFFNNTRTLILPLLQKYWFCWSTIYVEIS